MAYLRRQDKEARRREEKLERLVDETREFNREILLRNEKVYTAMIAQLEKNTEQMRLDNEQIRSNTEETRAQTQALLKLIDRFDQPGNSATAA